MSKYFYAVAIMLLLNLAYTNHAHAGCQSDYNICTHSCTGRLEASRIHGCVDACEEIYNACVAELRERNSNKEYQSRPSAENKQNYQQGECRGGEQRHLGNDRCLRCNHLGHWVETECVPD